MGACIASLVNLGAAQAVVGGQNGTDSIPFFPNNTKITLCVSDWTPAVYCEIMPYNETRNPDDFTGYEVELFRKIMPYMGWSDDIIDWKCLDFSEMMDRLYNNSGCDIAPSGLTPLPKREEDGLRFSISTYRSGYSIMVARIEEGFGPWYFFSAMSTKVWLILCLTAVIAGIIVWMFEVGMQALNNDTKWMSNVMWDTVGRPVQMRDYRLSSLPANILALTWSFSVFILMAMYTANLTANLTLSQIKNDIRGLADLPGKSVGSWGEYADDLKRYNLAIYPLPWENVNDELKMIETLKSGLIRALVMPEQTLALHDATDCGTMLVGKPFMQSDQAHAFPSRTWEGSDDLLLEYNQAITEIMMLGGMEELQNRFVTVPEASCKTGSVDSEKVAQVEWGEVSGLWIMLAVALGLGCLIVALYWANKWSRSKLSRKRWYRRMCCMPVDPKDKRSLMSSVTRSYSELVHLGLSGSFGAKNNAVKPDGKIANLFGHSKMDNELWDDRYEGASTGYLDGSSDVQEVERHEQARAARATRGLTRTDTASERQRTQAAAFEDLSKYLMQLVESRAEALANARAEIGPSKENEVGEDSV